MDVLRTELNAVFVRQHLEQETLPIADVEQAIRDVGVMTAITHACAVITDVAQDKSWLFPQWPGNCVGLGDKDAFYEIPSSDEDALYMRMHPEDLVDKRMLELKFATYTDKLDRTEKLNYKAACRIRVKNTEGAYILMDNTTQLLRLSPKGRMWLFLCTYSLSRDAEPVVGINARIINERTGEIMPFSFSDSRSTLLSLREKEVLRCIQNGMLSKEISQRLHISINTVNRHRQNILRKLSVGNSMEAVNAAIAMRLL